MGILLVNECFSSLQGKHFLTIGNQFGERLVGGVGILIICCVAGILDNFVMIDLRVLVKGSIAVVMMLALILPMADANARDIRWLREEQGNAGREQSRRQPEQWQQRQQGQQRGFEEDRRSEQRLSPEERRQLRRDIRDAGREIYPRRR